jgi:hypothetical protein
MRWWRGRTLNLSRLILILAYRRKNCTIIYVELASLSTGIDFVVPEFSFVSVTEDEVCNAVMSSKSNAAEVDEIPLSFIKSLMPVLLGTLTHFFNHIFTCSE